MKRFELSTLSLARRCSTTELHPHFRRTHQRRQRHYAIRGVHRSRGRAKPTKSQFTAKCFDRLEVSRDLTSGDADATKLKKAVLSPYKNPNKAKKGLKGAKLQVDLVKT